MQGGVTAAAAELAFYFHVTIASTTPRMQRASKSIVDIDRYSGVAILGESRLPVLQLLEQKLYAVFLLDRGEPVLE
jgi:hypothetical protein